MASQGMVVGGEIRTEPSRSPVLAPGACKADFKAQKGPKSAFWPFLRCCGAFNSRLPEIA